MYLFLLRRNCCIPWSKKLAMFRSPAPIPLGRLGLFPSHALSLCKGAILLIKYTPENLHDNGKRTIWRCISSPIKMVIFQCHVGFEGGNDRIGQPSKNHQSHPGQESVFGSQSSSRAFRIPTKRRMRAFCTNKSSRPKPPEFRVETPQNDWGGVGTNGEWPEGFSRSMCVDKFWALSRILFDSVYVSCLAWGILKDWKASPLRP